MLGNMSRTWMIVGTALAITSIGVGTSWSYFKTAQGSIRQAVRDAVPISFELQRLEQMTKDLIPEIRANQKVAAQLEVEMEYLSRETEALRESQNEEKSKMQKIRNSLCEGKQSYLFGGKTFTAQEVEHDLSLRLERYKNVANDIHGKEKLLEAKQKTLRAATEKISQYQHQQDLLEEKSESLQAELNLVELAKAGGNFEFDDSKLADAKRLAQDVEKRIRTMHKLIEGNRHVDSEIPVEADDRSVVNKFDDYFGQKSSVAKK
ncbi:coiled-coil domain-containing protein [Gimesia panareensis]|uniref:hypothetical protein n=1 Tax=Gimesia panareensis TaxID=2527978 RepID=UPI001188D3B9|nr:hypothetical protein [Gimesia panareensis]QDU52927.1 hypothetical protein Pan110_53090 [Gimesia panareensis]